MKKRYLIAMWMGVFMLSASITQADQYTDLNEYAKQVPVAEIDPTIRELILNETNENPEGMTSHYTLALYEKLSNGNKWYILDGYFKLRSGRILFLDFEYDPQTKKRWPIGNYENMLPGRMSRYLLEAEEICNPYRRNFVGVLKSTLSKYEDLLKIQNFFERHKDFQPTYVLQGLDLTIIDPAKNDSYLNKVLFTLDESNLISKLRTETSIESRLVLSGRNPSNDQIKQTYRPVKESCASEPLLGINTRPIL